MGNEASLEGGEGSLSELAEGLSSDGKGGFVQISTGEKVDLSHLSEEERIKLTASVSKGTGIPPGSSRDAATLRQALSLRYNAHLRALEGKGSVDVIL